MTAHPSPDDLHSVRAWLADWGTEVASVDFDTAETRFVDEVVGFGTRATEAVGRAALRSNQWEHVWPAIEGFGFEADTAHVWVSPDRLQAVIAGGWHSSGRTEHGETFPRRGRATVVLVRHDVDARWRGVHTHFSLEPLDPGTYTGSSS